MDASAAAVLTLPLSYVSPRRGWCRAVARSPRPRCSPTTIARRRCSASAASVSAPARSRTRSPSSTHAVDLARRPVPASDRLGARAYEWRSRCFQLLRDWESAQLDAERSQEHALSAGDEAFAANALFQSSLIAERRGETLMARYFAEQPLEVYVRLGDRQSEARMLNNLGGLTFLLGTPELAVGQLTQSFAISLELDNKGDAAQAISSLAQVHLRCGAPQLAEEQARQAIELLDGRRDFLDERGNVQLVLGRALLAQARVDEAMSAFASAEWAFEQLGSRSHVAAVWTAQGDAYRLQGDLEAAAELYRRVVESLQDFTASSRSAPARSSRRPSSSPLATAPPACRRAACTSRSTPRTCPRRSSSGAPR